MIGNRLQAEDQVAGDVGVVVSLRDQVEDFALAVGEFGEDLGQFEGLFKRTGPFWLEGRYISDKKMRYSPRRIIFWDATIDPPTGSKRDVE